MHELSLCRSIDGIVRRAAQGRPVSVVELAIGELRQVVPETLEHCWSVVSQGTELANSRLEVQRIEGVIQCRDCQAKTRLAGQPTLRCGSCSGTVVDIVSGEEFMVTAVSLEI